MCPWLCQELFPVKLSPITTWPSLTRFPSPELSQSLLPTRSTPSRRSWRPLTSTTPPWTLTPPPSTLSPRLQLLSATTPLLLQSLPTPEMLLSLLPWVLPTTLAGTLGLPPLLWPPPKHL